MLKNDYATAVYRICQRRSQPFIFFFYKINSYLISILNEYDPEKSLRGKKAGFEK
ncbi:hypothetical protein [uncultured Rikenella sp.]|uniref:hypothetical protein n=1 Tax=uncultured Rikenella sp. TaxID=368003 RepID=UPI002626D126|nr:hypothetical protein [uncultured Rikenella sp.]